MEFITRHLTASDVEAVSALDKKWFGEYGISIEQIAEYISSNPSGSLALLANGNFQGFATFEILEHKMPTNYEGSVPSLTKVLFIQQFTTTTNYFLGDMRMDIELLRAIELKAKEHNCEEVWEALATTHPYSKNQNSKYDAFGFYENNGYTYDKSNLIVWSPDANITIPCYLFRKKLTK